MLIGGCQLKNSHLIRKGEKKLLQWKPFGPFKEPSGSDGSINDLKESKE